MKRVISLWLMAALLMGCLWAQAEEQPINQKEYFDSKESLSYMADVPGRGLMRYYAQNDPLYQSVRYENRSYDNHRKFATGACVPTTLAMALANLLPIERLPELGVSTYRNNGFRFCTCSCSPFHCNGEHEQYLISTPEEYYRYLPLVMGAYACGNGPKGIAYRRDHGGTSTGLFKVVCNAYGLTYKKDASFADALEGIDRGGICIVSTGSEYTPFSKGGHYMVLASYDDDYLYILDPNIRESYKPMDRRNLLEILDTGLVRADRSNLRKLYLTSYFVIYPPEAPAKS